MSIAGSDAPWSALQPESTSQGENTGDMVGPRIRTQDLSDESSAPYRSELSGLPDFFTSDEGID